MELEAIDWRGEKVPAWAKKMNLPSIDRSGWQPFQVGGEFEAVYPSVLGMICRRFHPGMEVDQDLATQRKRLRDHCVFHPGVYRWYDSAGRLIYVGKSKSLATRLISYFQKNPADEKMRRIRETAHWLFWEETSHEFLALVREQELISRFRPGLNVQGQPQRRRLGFLYLSDHQAPNIQFSFHTVPDAKTYFGPILGTSQLREAVEVINHHFSLRDCAQKTPMDFGVQLSLFHNPVEAHCLRHEIGTCLGPCAAKVSSSDYQAAIQKVLDFLAGRSPGILKELQHRMDQAAKERNFERAASLRDRVETLSWVDRRLADLRRAEKRLSCIYQVTCSRGESLWAILRKGRLVSVVPAPRNKRSSKLAISEIRKKSGQEDSLKDQHPVSLTLLRSIAISWFRKNKNENRQLISFKQAEEVCSSWLNGS